MCDADPYLKRNLQAAVRDSAITLNYGRFGQEIGTFSRLVCPMFSSSLPIAEYINSHIMVVSFMTVSFALYQLLRVLSAFFKWNLAFDDRDCPYCLSNIPLKATRCRHCAADLADSMIPVENAAFSQVGSSGNF